MKIIFKCLLLPFILLISTSLSAQVGIGITTPNLSSVLDVFSTNKGFLMPRLSEVQRGLIVSPATGLMIYNTTSNDGQLNIGTPLTPDWIGLKRLETATTPMMYIVTEDESISTTSTDNLLATGMTMSPSPGTYIALFNAQMSGTSNTITIQSFSSLQGVTDMEELYQALMVMPDDANHALTFGNGETLLPGIYDVLGAPSITGILTLNGNGDQDSIFIIRSTGPFTTGTNTTVNLINGANSKNVFWVSDVALSTGAHTILKGNLVSAAGAISLGANTDLEGRMLTKSGALSIGASVVITTPSESSSIDLGVLSTFAMFSSSGAISDAVTSTITGDVGTALGALTLAGTHNGIEYPAGTIGIDDSTTTVNSTTYSIYLNGLEVANSSRTIELVSSIVSLQAEVTVIAENNPIEIRWKVDDGKSTLKNRALSLIRSKY